MIELMFKISRRVSDRLHFFVIFMFHKCPNHSQGNRNACKKKNKNLVVFDVYYARKK